MSLIKKPPPKYTPQKDIELEWSSFNGGWNNLFRPTELRPNELAQADNMMLVGQGTPTGRWGSVEYNLAGQGRVRLLDAYYNSNTSTNLLLAITDLGYLTYKNGASYVIVTGASFASGVNYQSAQLDNNTYIAGVSLPFIKFNGTNLIPYEGLSTPTNVSAAMISYASGFNTYSWRITAVSRTGETLGSQSQALASLPLDLTRTLVRVTWNTVSAASGVLTGYNIYRGFPGDETYIASTGPQTTEYSDTGTPQSNTVFPPNSDTTTGPRARYILKFQDRLILAGIPGDGSKVLISARYPYHDRFTAIDGGGGTYVSPNDGDDITGLGITNPQTQTPLILVTKGNAKYVVKLDTVTLGNFTILDPQVYPLTTSSGVSSGDSLAPVETDYFGFGRKGLYSTGQEAQFLNQVRDNEISARIRNYVQNLSDNDFKEACAGYLDYKYVLSFPTRKETIVYDRQRGAFMGPWKTSFGITKWFKYTDPSGSEKWLAGCTDGYVREFSSSYVTDSGEAIAKIMRTKKENFGKWSTFKIIKYFYFLIRNLRGECTVALRIETRNGNLVTTKSATISGALGSGGWGGDMWGNQQWGQTSATVSLTGDELARYSQIFKQARVAQVEISSTGANSNFELLSMRFTAQDLGPSSLPSSTRV